MSKFRFAIQTSIFVILILGTSALVNAQATRTWVSGVGDDVNPCSRTAPCKTFAGAISKTATNGEINCLDPAGYGAVTVTKSITIDCEDTQGSILSAGTNGVIVNITAATDLKKSFKLRGVSINGAGTGINGIRILSATNVTLQEVVIDGVTQHGVSVETTVTPLKMLVDATTIRSNAGHGINAFPILPSTLNLTVNNSTFAYNAQNGLNLADNVKASAFGSVFMGSANGVLASNAQLYLKDCIINYNTTAGIRSQSGANVIMHGVSVTANPTGISNAATVTSVTGTNSITQNTIADGAPNAFAPGV
jgi:Right handed beta helix region